MLPSLCLTPKKKKRLQHFGKRTEKRLFWCFNETCYYFSFWKFLRPSPGERRSADMVVVKVIFSPYLRPTVRSPGERGGPPTDPPTRSLTTTSDEQRVCWVIGSKLFDLDTFSLSWMAAMRQEFLTVFQRSGPVVEYGMVFVYIYIYIYICKMYVCWKLTTQLKQYFLNPANELTLAETNTWFWMIAFFSMNVHLGGICQLCWFYHLRIKSSTGGTLISHCQFPYDILDCSSDRSTPTAW